MKRVLDVLCAAVLISVSNAASLECPSRSMQHTTTIKQFNNKCYHFVNIEKYWTDARKFCWEYGGGLIHIESDNTQNWVSSTLNSISSWTNNGVWIGLTDKGHEGVYKWVTNTEFQSIPLTKDMYTHWASGEPGSGWKDCVRMVRGEGWRWKDTFCSTFAYKYKFICEFPVVTTTTSTTTTEKPQISLHRGPRVYKVLSRQDATVPTNLYTTGNVVKTSLANDKKFSSDENKYFPERHSGIIAMVTGAVGILLFLLVIVLMIIICRIKSAKSKNYTHNLSQENIRFENGNIALPTAGAHSKRKANSYISHTSYSAEDNGGYAEPRELSGNNGGYAEPKELTSFDGGYLEPSKLKPLNINDTYLTTVSAKDNNKQLSDRNTETTPLVGFRGRYSGYLPMTGSKEKLQNCSEKQNSEDEYMDEVIYAEIEENVKNTDAEKNAQCVTNQHSPDAYS